MKSPPPPALDALFSQWSVGALRIPNRIVRSAVMTHHATDGLANARHRAQWAALARGGVGLLVTEAHPVHPSASTKPSILQLWRDDCIEPLAAAVSDARAAGARVFAQLAHHGCRVPNHFVSGPLWGPSESDTFLPGVKSHPMTVGEIREVLDAYAAAARRVKQAGLDGVEVHCTFTLPHQFISPLWNRRTDAYGGAHRLRFMDELLEALRGAVGGGFPITLRLTPTSLYPPPDLRTEDWLAVLPRWTPSLLDGLSLWSGFAPGGMPVARHAELAAQFRQALGVPVWLDGRIGDPVLADALVREGKVDGVGMVRALIADPELPRKAQQGALDTIRPCTGCNEGCVHPWYFAQPISCTVNPAFAAPSLEVGPPAPRPERVVVVGGGPAGMEVAWVAAQRGHRVLLVEQAEALGGQLRRAVPGPGRPELDRLVAYYRAALARAGVEVRLGQRVTPEWLAAQAPAFRLVLATGGVPARPAFPGADDDRVVLARDALDGATLGPKVLLLSADGGVESAAAAKLLLERGHNVTLVTSDFLFGEALDVVQAREITTAQLLEAGAQLLCDQTIVSWEQGRVVLREGLSGKERRLDGFDHLVAACGSSADRGLEDALRATGVEHSWLTVGDCYAPARLADALRSARQVGLSLGQD